MSASAEEQLAALVARVGGIADDVDECVSLLVRPGELPRFVVAEQLMPLGSALIPRLVKVIKASDTDADLRGCAALLGFSVGDREDCAMTLLDEIDADGPWALLAARRLADAGYPGAASAIERALRRTDASSIDAIVGLLDAFRSAGGYLPNDLRESLKANESWQVASALREFFPVSERS